MIRRQVRKEERTCLFVNRKLDFYKTCIFLVYTNKEINHKHSGGPYE